MKYHLAGLRNVPGIRIEHIYHKRLEPSTIGIIINRYSSRSSLLARTTLKVAKKTWDPGRIFFTKSPKPAINGESSHRIRVVFRNLGLDDGQNVGFEQRLFNDHGVRAHVGESCLAHHWSIVVAHSSEQFPQLSLMKNEKLKDNFYSLFRGQHFYLLRCSN